MGVKVTAVQGSDPKDSAGPAVVTTDPGSQKPVWRPAPENPQVPVTADPEDVLLPIKGVAETGTGGGEPQMPRVEEGAQATRSDEPAPQGDRAASPYAFKPDGTQRTAGSGPQVADRTADEMAKGASRK